MVEVLILCVFFGSVNLVVWVVGFVCWETNKLLCWFVRLCPVGLIAYWVGFPCWLGGGSGVGGLGVGGWDVW